MIKKSLICSLCLFFILTFFCATISLAVVDIVTENAEVQSAYETFIELQTAMNENELTNIENTLSKLEKITAEFDDVDKNEWEKIVNEKIGTDVFFNDVYEASKIVAIVDSYEAFCANKNAKTALDFVSKYDNLSNDSKQVIKVMINEIDSVYQEANMYLPSNNVKWAAENITYIGQLLEGGFEEGIQMLKDDIQKMKNIVPNMSKQELKQLAVLLGVENEMIAYNKAAYCWNTAEIIMNVGNAYKEYSNNPTKETAKAFIEAVDGYDQMYPDRTLLEGFFFDIDTDYIAASKLLDEVTDVKYTVVFEANEGTFKAGKTLTIEKWENGDEDTLEIPTREGYKFLGFFTEKTGGTSLEKYIAEAGIDGDLTFYAQWEKVTASGGVGNTDTDNTNAGNTNIGTSNTDNANTNKPKGNNPQTGDAITIWISILSISIVGLLLIRKKDKV